MKSAKRWRATVAIAAAAALILVDCAAAGADEAAINTLANRFQALPHCSSGGISIGIVDNGKSSLLSAGSVHPRGGDARAIREDDEFQVGSITKTFTATLYALALSEGKVAADAPAQDYMPEGVTLPVYQSGGKTIPITLDSLARHASGLPRSIEGGSDGLSRQEMIDQLRSARLSFAPGSGFLYSNLGFAVLALAMERVYNGKIEDLLPQMVAAPLGMNNTGFGGGVLEGYRPNGEPAPEVNPTWPAFDGAAALRSTPADMQQFLLYNMRLASSERLSPLLPTLQKTVHLQARGGEGGGRPRDIGLAWQNANLPDGRHVIWKDGNVPGFRSYIGFTTTAPQTGVVVMASQNGCRTMKLGRCILESLSNAKPDGYCANPEAGDGEDNGAEP
jgi:D-alanyl-D-alanine-carboxypeptidase/D-alanyl-D-alanine-endopeptidase